MMASMSEGLSGMARVPAVEVFQAGTHRGRQYTLRDLDDIVRNFRECARYVEPPAVIGHEENQELLDNTGLPAVGRVRRLWRQGPTLFADLDRVPRSIARLIDARAYSKVSAEIYDEPPEGVPGQGKMLRRVALLGGDLPQIKTLADLPLADYGEYSPRQRARQAKLEAQDKGQVVRSRAGAYWCFSEVHAEERQAMGHEEMVQKLQAMGFDEAVLGTLSDEQMAEILRCSPQHGDGEANPGPAPGEEATPESEDSGQGPADQRAAPAREMADYDDQPDGSDQQPSERDQLIQQLTDMGQDPAQLSTLDDTALRALLEQLQRAETQEQEPAEEHAEGGEPVQTQTQPQQPAAGPAAPTQKMGAACGPRRMGDDMPPGNGAQAPKRVVQQTTTHYSETRKREVQLTALERRIKAGEKRLARIESSAQKKEREIKRGQVVAFCEAELKIGRLLPREVDAGCVDFAVHLDNTLVQKFGEGTTAFQGTALENWMHQIRSRPILVTLAERVKATGKIDPQTGKSVTSDDAEVAEVQRFSEVHSDALQKIGTRPAEFVERFKKARKKDPSFTARQYVEA